MTSSNGDVEFYQDVCKRYRSFLSFLWKAGSFSCVLLAMGERREAESEAERDLLRAASDGNVERMRQLLDQGVYVNIQAIVCHLHFCVLLFFVFILSTSFFKGGKTTKIENDLHFPLMCRF